MGHRTYLLQPASTYARTFFTHPSGDPSALRAGTGSYSTSKLPKRGAPAPATRRSGPWRFIFLDQFIDRGAHGNLAYGFIDHFAQHLLDGFS